MFIHVNFYVCDPQLLIVDGKWGSIFALGFLGIMLSVNSLVPFSNAMALTSSRPPKGWGTHKVCSLAEVFDRVCS